MGHCRAASLTSGGVAITYSVSPDGHVLTGSANGTPVFTVTLTDINTGAFEVTLLQPVDHPVKGSEDTLTSRFPTPSPMATAPRPTEA